MSRLLGLLDLRAGRTDVWVGPGGGPVGKRSYGGQLTAQAVAAAGRTVDPDRAPTNLHVQFLRAGAAGEPVEYAVERVSDGRTAAARRVSAMQGDRLLATATVSFASALSGPDHGKVATLPGDPDRLSPTGPAGPAPSMPLDEIDIRIADVGCGGSFRRHFWWRTTVALPDDPLLHACIALYVTDVYMIDPALQVHGHALADRTHRTGTTGTSVWLHRPIRSDRWNLLESTSPAAARGRGVVTAALLGADGTRLATLVQEGLVTPRETVTTQTREGS